MSRYVEPFAFAAVVSSNGLTLSWPRCPDGPLLVSRAGGGPSVPVVMGPQGLVDWTATAREVMRVCFRHGPCHLEFPCGA